MNTHIDIVFIHTGNHFYLKNAITHAVYFNPDATVYLLGDESNAGIAKEFNGAVIHENVSKYMTFANELGKHYVHMSTNPYQYELFCFQRWFIIQDFMQKRQLQNVLCLDSDVLLYCNVNEYFTHKLSYDLTVCNHMTPCYTLLKYEILRGFTDYIMSFYTDKERIKEIDEHYHQTYFDLQGKRIKMGGVCDMTAFLLYQTDISNNVLELTTPVDGACFDGNIKMSEGFKLKDGLKDVVWIDDLPYGKYGDDGTLVRFLGLHFQGGSKMKQYKFLIDKNGKHIEKLSLQMSWILLKAWLKKVIYAAKNFRYELKTFLWKRKRARASKW